MTVCDDYPDLIQTFEITENVRASVELITPESLMRLYQAGGGIFSCSIVSVNAPTLEFYNRGNKIVGICELQIEHEVEQELKTPEEFISFTKAFFENTKHLIEQLIFKNGSLQSPVEITN